MRPWLSLLAPAAIVAGIIGSQIGSHQASCNIKGNISFNTGERIYHVPGQKYYAETIISPSKGERWFCSEKEALAAGWRKARQ